MPSHPLRVGFVMEHALGHVTHAQAVKAAVEADGRIDARWMPIGIEANGEGGALKLPFSVKHSLLARGAVRQALREQPLDCLFFHTQGLTPCCLGLISRVPSFISMDATPNNFRVLASAYGERPTRGLKQRAKTAWFRQVFNRAAGLVAWSTWVRDSLVEDYGVDPAKVAILPPGVDTQAWRPGERADAAGRRPRLLFVGGDFERKGGPVVLQAYREALSGLCELDIVTPDPSVQEEPGVRVHRGLRPNMPELKRLFAEADLFVLPTRGDASPFAVLEALASGLPVVSTDVGAIGDMVEHGVHGHLIPVNDPSAFARSVRSLLGDPTALRAMGRAARRRVEERFHATTNYARLVEHIRGVGLETARRG